MVEAEGAVVATTNQAVGAIAAVEAEARIATFSCVATAAPVPLVFDRADRVKTGEDARPRAKATRNDGAMRPQGCNGPQAVEKAMAANQAALKHLPRWQGVRLCYKNWTSVTADKVVLSVVQRGVELKLREMPPPSDRPPRTSCI